MSEFDIDYWKDRAEKAERQRDFLVEEYERAVGCGSQGFAHAAGHLFNAISNARCDSKVAMWRLSVNAERDLCDDFLALCGAGATPDELMDIIIAHRNNIDIILPTPDQ